jgi:hypothetical protein
MNTTIFQRLHDSLAIPGSGATLSPVHAVKTAVPKQTL